MFFWKIFLFKDLFLFGLRKRQSKFKWQTDLFAFKDKTSKYFQQHFKKYICSQNKIYKL